MKAIKFIRIFLKIRVHKQIIKLKNAFTLTEVTMAIGVIALGMMGIMALFPVGFQAAKDSMGDNYSSQMAEQFLRVVKMQVLEYNGNGIYSAGGGRRGGGDNTDEDGDGIPDYDGWGEWIGILGAAVNNPRILQLTQNTPSAANLDTGKVWSAEIAKAKNQPSARFLGDLNGDWWDDSGIYFDVGTVLADPDADAGAGYADPGNNAGVFYVEARTGEIVDWTGVMYLWWEPIMFDDDNDGIPETPFPSQNGPIANAVRLCLEISWPYEKPYERRRKRVYALEVYNTIGR